MFNSIIPQTFGSTPTCVCVVVHTYTCVAEMRQKATRKLNYRDFPGPVRQVLERSASFNQLLPVPQEPPALKLF